MSRLLKREPIWHDGRTYDRFWPANDRSPAVVSSNFSLLRHLEGVVNLDAEISDRALDLCVPEEQLDCA